jgi:outer membrane receptor protein involved in Fe transport
LNNSQTIEPRASLEWKVSPKSSFTAGFGMHSMAESIITYYATVYDNEGNKSTPNKNLGLTRANHYILGYDYQIRKNLNVKAEVYYQDLYDVPVGKIASTYSVLNEQNGFISRQLVNEGKGRNYGAELSIERSFDKRFYFLVTGSLYKSEYKTLEDVWHNTKFNGDFATNFLIGKEFVFGDEKRDKYRVLNISTRVMYNGGRRYLPLNLEASQQSGYGIFHDENAYADKMGNIFQMNATVSLKFNRPRSSHEILVDIYNVLNSKSPVSEYYNPYTREKGIIPQLSMLPNIMYRIHF